jgi:hypothetical protein
MAYSTSNPPAMLTQTMSGNKLWFYSSTDAATAVRVSGYITDGYDLGMRAGDMVIVVDSDATPIAMQLMIVTSATSSAVDLSDGTAVTATDTD